MPEATCAPLPARPGWPTALLLFQPPSPSPSRAGQQTGYVERASKQGEETATGMQKETFGEGSAAQSAAGKKGERWAGAGWAEGMSMSRQMVVRERLGCLVRATDLALWCPSTCIAWMQSTSQKEGCLPFIGPTQPLCSRLNPLAGGERAKGEAPLIGCVRRASSLHACFCCCCCCSAICCHALVWLPAGDPGLAQRPRPNLQHASPAILSPTASRAGSRRHGRPLWLWEEGELRCDAILRQGRCSIKGGRQHLTGTCCPHAAASRCACVAQRRYACSCICTPALPVLLALQGGESRGSGDQE